MSPNYLFSLSPIRQVKFEVYQDLKYTLEATIHSPELPDLVKAYFLRVLAYKLKDFYRGDKQITLPKIFDSDLTPEQAQRAEQHVPDAWLDYLGMANKSAVCVKVVNKK